MSIEFIKMHGLGNDFIIVDAREKEITLSQAEIKLMSDRNFGIGCDQLVILKNSADADVEMVIYNQDGTEAQACGNATRCVAKLLNIKSGKIKVGSRNLQFWVDGKIVSVDMGKVSTLSSEIPVKHDNPMEMFFEEESIIGHAVSIGNPHLIFFLKSTSEIDLNTLGPKYEHHFFFPEGVNVTFAKVIDKKNIEAKVWERGAGATLACGSAACAVAYVAKTLELTESTVNIHLPGGALFIEVKDGGNVIMSGPAEETFKGVFFI